ncbi:hypothetical protein TrVE_jg1959 [Triparma verrucosa]|uniref:C2 domain-containing protein n=1 Tax=Triparma verrucosa TaxID=1606542 RepID=A0A9W7ER19_9STRA|nr:hypothetical protein TrVE_jg1959 [Triparma verrucosa]
MPPKKKKPKPKYKKRTTLNPVKRLAAAFSSSSNSSKPPPKRTSTPQDPTQLASLARLAKVQDELNTIISLDSDTSPRYIVSTRFLTLWLSHTCYEGVRPTMCDNADLLVIDKKKNLKIKENLELDKHFRHVSKGVWNAYERYYPKSGPTIVVESGDPSDSTNWLVVNERMGKELLLAKKETTHKQRKSNMNKREKRISKLEDKMRSSESKRRATLKAVRYDSDLVLYNNDTSETLDFVLSLSESLQVDFEEDHEEDHEFDEDDEVPTNVVPRAWVTEAMNFCLGLDLTPPKPCDNSVLLAEVESFVGKTWTKSEMVKGLGVDYVLVKNGTWREIIKRYQGSGPSIQEFKFKADWQIDEGFMLRKYCKVEKLPENHDDVAAVSFFMDGARKKKIEEGAALDKLLQKEENKVIAQGVIWSDGRGEVERISKEEKEVKLREATMALETSQRSREHSINGKARHRNNAGSEEIKEEAAEDIRRWYLSRRIARKKAALTEQKSSVTREWAARKVQGAYLRFKGRKKLNEVKLRRKKLKEEMAAIRVEAVWRTHIAKNTIKKNVKDRKLQGAAAKITASWRGRVARHEVEEKKKVSSKLVGIARRIIENKRTDKLRRQLSHVPIRIRITKASGLDGRSEEMEEVNKQESDTAQLVEPPTPPDTPTAAVQKGKRNSIFGFAASSSGKVIKGLGNLTPTKKNALPSPRLYVSGFGGTTMTSACLTKSSTKTKTSEPVWNETLVVSGEDVNGNSTITLTALDHDKIKNHSFLGQAVIDLTKVLPDSFFSSGNDKTFKLDAVKFKRYRLPVPDYSGNGSIKVRNAENVGFGDVDVEFLPVNPGYSHCGWLAMRGGTSGGGGFGVGGGGLVWELKWCVLIDKKLTVHSSPFRLNEILFSIKTTDVESWKVEEVESEVNIRNRRASAVLSGAGKEAEANKLALVNKGTFVKEATVKLLSRKNPFQIRVPKDKEGAGLGAITEGAQAEDGNDNLKKAFKNKEGMWFWKLKQAFGYLDHETVHTHS